MSKIWLDVTSILGWSRPSVGVVRVESECARFALQHLGSDVEFCRFDRHQGFLRVDPDDVESALYRIDRTERQSSEAEKALVSPRTLEERVEYTARAALQKIPPRVRAPLSHYLLKRRESVKALVGALRELRRAIRIWRTTSLPEVSKADPCFPHSFAAPFSQGDAYISLGLDWDQKDQSFLAQVREELSLKCVLICYDVIPVKFPHLCVGDVSAKFARYFADISWCADEILCISECSRRDLIELLEELGTRIPSCTVVQLGSEIPAPKNETSEIMTAAGKRFILFVSTIERRKNHETLYRAYTRLVDQGERDLPKLVFVGMVGWGVSDFLADLRFDPRISGLVEVLTNVSDADLTWLYKNALFTVFPSLYEGWGLAVAESLASGKFCLASNAASIPEVGGDLIEYLDPWDVPKWAERLKWYFDHPEELKQAEERIKVEYAPKAWQDTAKAIFGTAEALLTPSRSRNGDIDNVELTKKNIGANASDLQEQLRIQ